jgi:hypothetical protein
VKYGDETLIVTIVAGTTFEAFETLVWDKCKSPNLSIKYESDGEWVTMRDTTDLVRAVTSAQVQTARKLVVKCAGRS